MGNIATSINEQIGLLRKRGMTLDLPESKIKEVLLDIGYYRLGFYWYPFANPLTHDFIDDCKFTDALQLYYFDTDLRNILTKYLTRFEINFRTVLIYEGSNAFKNFPTWFINPAIVEKGFISNFPKYYNKEFVNNNKPIKKHHSKYINDKYAPAWKTIEFLTFGSVYRLFDSIKDQKLKKTISNYYGIRDEKTFSNHLKTIISIRNICAHNSVLYDFNTAKGIKNIPALALQQNERNSLSGVLKLLSYYIGKVSMNRKNDFEKELLELRKTIKENLSVKSIISENIGI